MARTQSEIGKSNVNRSKSHERRVAKLLGEWSGEEFRRRKVEGRDSTVIERESTADVIPVKKQAHFSIEAKCGKKFSIDAMLANPTGSQFTKWWHQTCYDAQLVTEILKEKYYPLLFFKPLPNWDWVAVSKNAINDGILKFNPEWKDITIEFEGKVSGVEVITKKKPWFEFDIWNGPVEGDVSHSKKNPVMKFIDLDPCYIMRWRDFEQCIDPKSFFRD